jgi:hypothetical protein
MIHRRGAENAEQNAMLTQLPQFTPEDFFPGGGNGDAGLGGVMIAVKVDVVKTNAIRKLW